MLTSTFTTTTGRRKMNRTQLLKKIRQRTGHVVPPAILVYAIQTGRVEEPPRNPKNNNSIYDNRHFRQLARYVRSRRGKVVRKSQVKSPKPATRLMKLMS
jgi:hypothetical protein